MILIESIYDLGDIVYLKTDKEQDRRIVTQICIATTGIQYQLACGIVSTWHSDFEITKQSDILVKTGVDEPTGSP